MIMDKFTIEDQFKKHLIKNGTSFSEYIKYNSHRSSTFFSYEYLLNNSYRGLICEAFKWSTTPRGHGFWRKIDESWINIIDEYLSNGFIFYDSDIIKDLYND